MLFGTQSQPASLAPGPTPSGQLSDSIRNMCLASQGLERPPAGPSQRPPVPLFAETQPTTQQCGPCHPGSGGPPPSQMDYLATQDFITPADQFDLAYDPAAAAATGRPPRSPAALSPGRVKRARTTDPENDPVAGSHPLLSAPLAPLARRPGGGATAARPGGASRRIRDPPTYRSVFNAEEADEDSLFEPWTKPRPAAGDLPAGRYRLEFKELGYLGTGTFSKVFSARHRLDGMRYAVKRSLRESAPGSDEFSQFLQEAQVLASLPPHPNVVRYYGCWTEHGPREGEHLYMQLEACEGSLRHAWGAEAMSEANIIDLGRQVAAALAHCHAAGVAHLDVKPDNIFVIDENKGGDTPRFTYKLGDFGQAARLRGAGGCTIPEGDARYIPLERMNGDVEALDKADTFALGVVMFELAATTAFELPREGQAYQDLRRGKMPLLPTNTSTFTRILRALLAENPAERPSAERALAMLQRAAAAGGGTQGEEVSTATAATAPAEPM